MSTKFISRNRFNGWHSTLLREGLFHCVHLYIYIYIFIISYSYFYEAFEAFNSLEDTEKAIKSIKYMLLTKIMTNNQDDVNSLLASKNGLKYAGKVFFFIIIYNKTNRI